MKKIVSTNPAKNYEVLGEVPISTKKEIAEKVAQANRAKKEWKETELSQRIDMLKCVYEGFSKRRLEFALLKTREMGMPINISVGEIYFGLQYFRGYLDVAEKILAPETTFEDSKTLHRVFYEPIGTAAVIIPWNFPFSNFIWGVIPNLLVGNTVVLKHAEECPLSGKFIEEVMTKAGLPKGVFSEVYGNAKVGSQLVHEPIDLICFTGSTAVGKLLYETAAKKFIKVILECGGSDPGIVFADADIPSAIQSIVYNRFLNCGQACNALKRLIVEERIADLVVKQLKAAIESQVVGDPEDTNTTVGPLVSKKQQMALTPQVQDALKKGAKIITGGKIPKHLKGAYYLPTLLTNVTPDMRVWKEEVFGPVLPVVTFKTDEEAIALANDTPYGLGGYVYSGNRERRERVASQLQAGGISINGADYLLPCNPFGGYKASGIGREHGKWGFYELCEKKVVAEKK